VAISLAIFALVYFIVFGAGVFYILRLMGKAPLANETGPEQGIPARAAGGMAFDATEHPRQPAE